MGWRGRSFVDERGVNERLERLRGIESLELLLGRRRVDQLPVHGLCRRCRGRQRQFEEAAKRREMWEDRERDCVLDGQNRVRKKGSYMVG